MMEEKPFEKISISDICERCDMNRKSFYYHFKDKYDLVNYIFDTECMTIANVESYEDRIDLLLELCRYFYANHKFYRSALQVRGQNSFREHFHEFVSAMVMVRLRSVLEEGEIPEMCINFCADGFTCAIVRWMMEKVPVPPEEVVDSLVTLIKVISAEVYQIMK